MKIITEPTVTVVGKTAFIEHPDYPIPPDGDDPVRLCAFAAKCCYDSYGRDGRANLDNQAGIVKSGHGSVLEHYHVSLFIEGVTRGLSLELNRHRHFNISQRSTRYTAEEEAAVVLDPYYAELYRTEAARSYEERLLLSDHIRSCEASVLEYRRQVEGLIALNPNELTGTALRKWARGKARNLLPHALETRGTWTNNIRGWRHFLEMRSSRHAEAEIRRLTEHVFYALREVTPFYLLDYRTEEVDGFLELTTANPKV